MLARKSIKYPVTTHERLFQFLVGGYNRTRANIDRRSVLDLVGGERLSYDQSNKDRVSDFHNFSIRFPKSEEFGARQIDPLDRRLVVSPAGLVPHCRASSIPCRIDCAVSLLGYFRALSLGE